jgi:hypothetical protein
MNTRRGPGQPVDDTSSIRQRITCGKRFVKGFTGLASSRALVGVALYASDGRWQAELCWRRPRTSSPSTENPEVREVVPVWLPGHVRGAPESAGVGVPRSSMQRSSGQRLESVRRVRDWRDGDIVDGWLVVRSHGPQPQGE